MISTLALGEFLAHRVSVRLLGRSTTTRVATCELILYGKNDMNIDDGDSENIVIQDSEDGSGNTGARTAGSGGRRRDKNFFTTLLQIKSSFIPLESAD